MQCKFPLVRAKKVNSSQNKSNVGLHIYQTKYILSGKIIWKRFKHLEST